MDSELTSELHEKIAAEVREAIALEVANAPYECMECGGPDLISEYIKRGDGSGKLIHRTPQGFDTVTPCCNTNPHRLGPLDGLTDHEVLITCPGPKRKKARR